MEETVVATRASSIRRESGTVRAMVMRSITTIVGCAPGVIREGREPGGPFERAEGSRMISATTPSIAGHRIIETKGQVFGLVVSVARPRRQHRRRPPLARGRGDP